MVNLIFIQIAVVFYKFLGKVIKFIKISCLKFFEIDLNKISEIIIFVICGCILNESLYNILIN